jgi:hypothetical protein
MPIRRMRRAKGNWTMGYMASLLNRPVRITFLIRLAESAVGLA